MDDKTDYMAEDTWEMVMDLRADLDELKNKESITFGQSIMNAQALTAVQQRLKELERKETS